MWYYLPITRFDYGIWTWNSFQVQYKHKLSKWMICKTRNQKKNQAKYTGFKLFVFSLECYFNGNTASLIYSTLRCTSLVKDIPLYERTEKKGARINPYLNLQWINMHHSSYTEFARSDTSVRGERISAVSWKIYTVGETSLWCSVSWGLRVAFYM